MQESLGISFRPNGQQSRPLFGILQPSCLHEVARCVFGENLVADKVFRNGLLGNYKTNGELSSVEVNP